ncbi:ATP-NAD kinase-like domain-containing protein [Lasiosphaeria miniovina]|uniref:ATP-NAD kinase-like domain-containing protein n=1 Tax=Lasiosphaeria miniovina TaxID=1954250 RepID=A0AA40EGS9_9PEZI|nr:ATP-NAD kinase-like domain-containing protein [Lasiosphaeria miniovina]KAK0735018.1 ATP-NAD kinase-like domain-containing protein [Lasiosphaeria miniovina]
MSGPISSPTAIHPALISPLADLTFPPLPLPEHGLNKSSASPSDANRPQSSSAVFAHMTTPPEPPTSPRNAVNADFASVEPSLGPQPTTTPSNSDLHQGTTPSALYEPPRSHPASAHRKNALSVESVPRQTIMKALASVARNNKPEALSLSGMLSAHKTATMPSGGDMRPSTSSSQQLCDALNGLAQVQNVRGQSMTPTAAFPSLQSPCFYHNRFDDAVDIDKVLEEIKNDDWVSHSRLVQTATSVREVSKQLQRRPIKRAVRNVMIVTKARDNQLVVLTRELAQWLLRTPRYGSDLGVNVFVDAKLRNSKRFNAPGIVAENPRFQEMLQYWSPDLCWTQPEKFDLVLTLGGDGTVLFTSWLFQRIVPPVLSFSLGSLGFLTSFEFERYRDHLNRVMGDEGMRVNLRMRFTCTVYRDGPMGHEMEEGEQFEVLNELVIDRGPSPYVSNLELYGDNELLTVIQADGCIFSTPTGSTAYSLSAGGSLVHPDIPAILLTPICPHTLSFRPMVLSDTMLLRVSIPRNSRATAYCAFDGKGRVELKQGDHVTITASQYPFPTVVRTDTEWFDSVSRTLRWNVRAATQKAFDTGDSAVGSEDGKTEEDDGWDIDTDSACYVSEESSTSASPLRRQMSLLGF